MGVQNYGDENRKRKTSDIPNSEIIEAVRLFHAGKGETPDIALAHKYPAKLILAKMQKMVDKGLLNYGVSLRTAWINSLEPSADERRRIEDDSP